MKIQKLPTPHHEHDCDEHCHYLGSNEDMDFYFHHGEHETTLIARHGIDGAYFSGMPFWDPNVADNPITLAGNLAIAQGYLEVSDGKLRLPDVSNKYVADLTDRREVYDALDNMDRDQVIDLLGHIHTQVLCSEVFEVEDMPVLLEQDLCIAASTLNTAIYQLYKIDLQLQEMMS